MARRNPKTFTLTFEIFRRGERLAISTDLPVRALPPGAVSFRAQAAPKPVAVIKPRLTRGLRRLLKMMVECEQEDRNTLTPDELIADMEAIVLTVYEASRNETGVDVDDLMGRIITPATSIAWCAQASSDAYEDSRGDDLPPRGGAFIAMLIDAARKAAQPIKPTVPPTPPPAPPAS